HRDHRLGGGVLQQPDLLLAKRADFPAVYRDNPEQLVVPAQRHRNITTGASEADKRLEAGRDADNLGFGEIRDRDQVFTTEKTIENASWRERPGDTWDRGQVLRWQPP